MLSTVKTKIGEKSERPDYDERNFQMLTGDRKLQIVRLAQLSGHHKAEIREIVLVVANYLGGRLNPEMAMDI